MTSVFKVLWDVGENQSACAGVDILQCTKCVNAIGITEEQGGHDASKHNQSVRKRFTAQVTI
jgi:hypothetical protein